MYRHIRFEWAGSGAKSAPGARPPDRGPDTASIGRRSGPQARGAVAPRRVPQLAMHYLGAAQ